MKIMIVNETIVLIALLIAGIEDRKNKEIHSIVLWMGFFFSSISYLLQSIFGAETYPFVITIILFAITFITKDMKICGGADIDSVLLLCTLLRREMLSVMILALGLALVGYYIIGRKRKERDGTVEFVFYLAISYAIWYCCDVFYTLH